MVTILVPQSWITLASRNHGVCKVYTILLFITMKVTMYGMPWILILILGTIPKCLSNDELAIHKLNGVGWGGGNLNFCFNPYVIAFAFDLPSKSTSSTMFFSTCITITTVWWSKTITSTMNVALEVVFSLGADYLLAAVRYLLRSSVSFNNWPIVTVILLSNSVVPLLFLFPKQLGLVIPMDVPWQMVTPPI